MWALLVLGILRLAGWLESPAARLQRARPGAIEATAEGLVITLAQRDPISVRRADVIEGWIEPLHDQSCLVLRLRGGRRLLVASDDPVSLRRLLTAAGASVEQQVFKVSLGTIAAQHGQGTVFHLLGPFLAGLCSLAAGCMMILGISSGDPKSIFLGLLFTLLATVFDFLLLRTMVSGQAIVGADGVTLKRLFRRRFVPYAEVESVSQVPHGVRITTRGEPLDLPLRTFVTQRAGTAAALVARIAEARAASRRPFDGASLALLDRGGRRVADWREALLRITHRAGDYRNRAVESADLAQVIEDASAPPERRIGAAMALATLPDDAALKERLRIAIQASANEPVRIALDRALSGALDDDDLVEVAAAPSERSVRGR